jgi:hypothetical protein
VTSNPPAEQGLTEKPDMHKRTTSIAEDVISKKGLYGRFTQRWFSKGDWTDVNKRKEGISTSQEDISKLPVQDQLSAVNPAPAEAQDQAGDGVKALDDASKDTKTSDIPNESPEEVKHAVEESSETPQVPLLPKLLTVSKIFFGSRSFFFSYDYDLSRSIANQPNSLSSVPLFRSFDPLVSVDQIEPGLPFSS